MKKIGLFVATAIMLVLFAFSASAAKEGYYFYNVENDEAKIMYVDESISGNITIPSSLGGYKVTSIGYSAFYNCDSIITVKIGDNVTNIGLEAFKDCNNLTSVTIGDGVTNIGGGAFSYCSSLMSVTIPGSVTSIDGFAFNGCTSLTSVTIGDSVTSISGGAFYNCSSLTNITIPDSVTSIGNSAFYKCTSLESVTIPNKVASIGDSAFDSCSNLTSITIPDSVTSIGQYAFQNCTGLKHLKIPASFEITSRETFDGIDGLEEIVISKDNGIMTSYDATTYKYTPWYKSNQSLKKLIIEDGVTNISNFAFYCCSSLESIIIPDSVTIIGYYAFGSCSSLTSVTIPNSVTSIGYDAFFNCPIKDVYYTGTRSQWKAIAIEGGNMSLTKATIHYTHKNIVDIPQQNPTCTKVGYTEGKQCSYCEEWISGHEEIPVLGHSYSSTYTIDKKATLSANGSRSKHCTRDGCTAKTSVTAIAKISSATLSTASCTYNGKTRNPSIIVKDSEGNTLAKGTDYTVTIPSGRKNPGEYEYVITFMGNYSGEKRLTFTILPKAPVRISATQSTSVIKLSWSESVGATGYRVYQYSPAKGKYVQIASVKGVNSYRKATNLKPGTEYSFKIKPYTKLSDGTVLWGTASEAFVTATECKAPVIKSVTSPSKQKATVKWSDVSGETGYTVYYSTKKDSGFKKYANFKADTTTCNITGLTSGKTYYFKVRTYIKTDSGYVYSAWSNVKGIKIK